ncbi:MAG: hypothetical protein ACKVOU_12525 [Cytophagales bacterium]
MVNTNVIDNWKAGHFVAYLYLAIADADNNTTDEEIAMSKRKVKVILDEYYKADGINHDTVVDEVRIEIKHHTDAEKTDLINNFNKKFKLGDDAQRDIVSDLTDIIESDDHVQASEHYMLSFIRVVLSKN